MKTVYKYSLALNDKIEIEMPADAEILDVQTQYGEPELWALVDTERPSCTYTFHLRGTGHTFTGAEGRHLGSFQMQGGALVFHLFADL